jgi:hypothetical protein
MLINFAKQLLCALFLTHSGDTLMLPHVPGTLRMFGASDQTYGYWVGLLGPRNDYPYRMPLSSWGFHSKMAKSLVP